MFKIYFVILLVFCSVFTASAQTEGIVWEKDFEKALALAKETGKPLMLDFSADWCKPCQVMDKEFWTLSEVVKAVQPFIAVKVNFDSERKVVKRYNVSAIPYVVFTDPVGNAITARLGFSKTKINELNQIFEEMPKDFTALKPFYTALEADKENGEALLKIADAYRGAKMLRLSNEFYKKALKTDKIKNDPATLDRIKVTLGINAYNSGDLEQSIEFMEDYLKQFPSGKNRELAVSLLSIANAKRGKKKNALKYLELLKTEFPASKNIQTATDAIENAKN